MSKNGKGCKVKALKANNSALQVLKTNSLLSLYPSDTILDFDDVYLSICIRSLCSFKRSEYKCWYCLFDCFTISTTLLNFSCKRATLAFSSIGNLILVNVVLSMRLFFAHLQMIHTKFVLQ